MSVWARQNSSLNSAPNHGTYTAPRSLLPNGILEQPTLPLYQTSCKIAPKQSLSVDQKNYRDRVGCMFGRNKGKPFHASNLRRIPTVKQGEGHKPTERSRNSGRY